MNSKIISRKEAADMLGVCTQSVSNYIKRGLLRQAGCARKGVCFVYLKEVEALAGKAQDLEKIEASIAAYEKELSGKEEALKEEVDLFYDERNIRGFYARYDFKHAILGCAAFIGVSDRSIDILRQFLSGKGLKEIAECYKLSTERTRQIICKTIRILNYRTGKYDTLRKENCELERRIRMLEAECKELREEVGRKEDECENLRKKVYLGKLLKNNTETTYRVWEGIDPSTPLVDLDLSVRALNCLKAADIETLYDLVRYNYRDLLRFRNFGKKALTELCDMLESLGLYFGIPMKIVDGQFVLCEEKEGGPR